MKELARDSGEIPPALANQPVLTMWQRYFWDAFHVLSSSRSFHSAGIASIQLTQIQAYFEIYGILDIELKDLYVKHIQTLDSVYIEHYSKKS